MKKIKIEFDNPFYAVKIFFLYHPIFWKLIILKSSKLGFMDIDRIKYEIPLIRHRISGKIVLHDGWGNNITQNSIYNVNGKYELMN
jgi:hypothetical protein